MEYLLSLLYTIFFLFAIKKIHFFSPRGVSFVFLSVVFALKVFSGFLLGWIYTHHYADGDTFSFFHDGNVLYQSLFQQPQAYLRMLTGLGASGEDLTPYYRMMHGWNKSPQDFFFNEGRMVIRLNAFFRLFSFGYYQVHVVFFNMLSFTGMVALYRAIEMHVPSGWNKSLFFIPSVLFWSSGVLKEAVVIFSFGLLVYAFFLLLHKRSSITVIVTFLIATYFLILTRFYLAGILLPSCIAAWWSEKSTKKYILLKFFLVHLFFTALFFATGISDSLYNLPDMLIHKHNNFLHYVKAYGGANLFSEKSFPETPASIPEHIPAAVANTLFRPFVWEARNPLMFFAGIENLFIAWLITVALIKGRSQSIEHKSFFYFALFAALSVLAFTGLSTPVMGVAVRHKIPALVCIVFFCSSLYSSRRVKRKIG